MASLSPLTEPLGLLRAAHLLRRTSFRFTKSKVDQLAVMNINNALTVLLTPPQPYLSQPLYDDSVTTAIEATPWINPVTSADPPSAPSSALLRNWVRSWWLSEAYEDRGLTYKMAFFLHQNATISLTSMDDRTFFDYLALIRYYALGNWKKFATKIVTDNCMLVYLNNQSNSANNPNENFAREFLELFTITKGDQVDVGDYTTYTEDDIVMAAKVFTGFRTKNARTTVDPDTNIPRGYGVPGSHNWTAKTFSNRLSNLVIPAVTVSTQKTEAKMFEELDLFVNAIFAQEETAKSFCRRLYRYYVNEKITPEIETDIIVPLAGTFRSNNYEIKPVLKQLLASVHFFGEDNTSSVENIVGGMIKSPLEMALQSISFFGLTPPDGTTNPLGRYKVFSSGVVDRMLALGGMGLFAPPDVAGYPAYHQGPDFSHLWFNTSTIITRYKLPTILLSGKYTIGGSVNTALGIKLDVVTWTKNSGFFSDPSDPYTLVTELLTYLLPKQLDDLRINYFYTTIFLDDLPAADWTYEWQNYLANSNDAEVKIPLERLIKAIMYSQEFQTM